MPSPAHSFPRTIYSITQRTWRELLAFQIDPPTTPATIPTAASPAKLLHLYLPADEKEMNTLVPVALPLIPGLRHLQPTTMVASNSLLLLQTTGDNSKLPIPNEVITGEKPSMIDAILPPTTEGILLPPNIGENRLLNIGENLHLPTSVITGESLILQLTTAVSHLLVIIDVTFIPWVRLNVYFDIFRPSLYMQTIDNLSMDEICSLHLAQATAQKVIGVNRNIAASAIPTTFPLRIAILTNTVASAITGTE